MGATLLTEEAVHDLISEIISSERIEYIEEDKEFIIFKVPSSSEKIYAEFVEKQALRGALNAGCVSEEDIPEEFINSFFSIEDSELLHEVENKINSYKTLLSKRIKGTDLYYKDKEKLTELQDQQEQLLHKKSEVNQYTAEYIAREEKLLTLLSVSTLDEHRGAKWSSKDEFLENSEVSYVYSLLNRFLSFYWGPDISIIRQIARSGEWRSIYLSSIKTSIDMFGRSVKDLSSTQLQLLSWSMYYQSVYDLPPSDRPSNDIIDEDESLDKYMDELSKKLKAEERSFNKNQSSKIKSKAENSDHVIVAAESNDYIRFNKEDAFSDTNLISNRADESTTVYSDSKEKQKIRSKIRKLNKK